MVGFDHDLALDKRIRAALIGPIVGTFLDFILGGICLQLWIRYVRSKGRSTWERSIVYAACVFALTNSIIHFHQVNDVALIHHGDTDRVVKFDWNFQITFLMNGVVLALVQSIYAYRVIKLYGSQLWMKLSLSSLVFVGLLANMGPSILSFAVPKPQDANDPQQLETYRLLKKYEPIILIMYVMNMVVDLVVCVATTLALRRSMKKVTNRTANFLKQYAYLSIQAMALPLACSIVAISIYTATTAQSSVDVAAVWPMHKLALISLFLLLLNRDHYRKKLNKNLDMTFELCSPTSPHRVNIERQIITEVVQDDYSPKRSVNRMPPGL